MQSEQLSGGFQVFIISLESIQFQWIYEFELN